MWIDSHCHPHLLPEGDDILAIQEAIAADIKMLCVATKLSDYKILCEYKKQFPENIMIALGQHPLECCSDGAQMHVDWSEFANIVAQDKNIIAIGETGLDINGDLKQQNKIFQKHVEIACMNNLPIILHTREVEEATKSAIKEAARNYKNLKGVFHCFTGTIDLAEFAIQMGWMISFSGIVTFKNAHSLREVAKHLYDFGYLDHVLIETDTPYLAPQAVRGKINKPSYVAYVGQFLAQIFQMPESDFAQLTTRNFEKLFGKERL